METTMSWTESDTGHLVAAISEEGESACLCLSLVSALVSQLVLVYVSVSVRAVRECSPSWYVSVSVSGGFWHFFASICVLDFPFCV